MAMPDKQLVACPHCSATQQEPVGVVSTVCRACSGHFSLEEKEGAGPRTKKTKTKPSRLVRCTQCENQQKVYEDALSAVCTACGAHLEIGSYTLEGVVRQRVQTEGDITFAAGSRYVGPEARGRTVTVAGRVQARVRAAVELVFAKKGEITGPAAAPTIRVAPGAEAVGGHIAAGLLKVEGGLKAKEVYGRTRIEVVKGGHLDAETLVARELSVAPGGVLQGRLDTTAAPAEGPTSAEAEK